MELRDFLARKLAESYMYGNDVSKETKRHLIKFAEEIIYTYDIMQQLEEAYEEEIAENFDEDGDYIYEDVDLCFEELERQEYMNNVIKPQLSDLNKR